MPNQPADFPTLVTYRSAEALRDDGIRYAYLKIIQFLGFSVAIAMTGMGVVINSSWPLGVSIVGMIVALFCARKAEFPSYVRLSVAEMDLMSREMSLPLAVIEQTKRSVLLGLPEEMAAMSASAHPSQQSTSGLVVSFPNPDTPSDVLTIEPSSDQQRDSESVQNVADLNVNRLKTPEEFQSEYLAVYEKHKREMIPWVFGMPAVCVAGAMGLLAYSDQVFKFDFFTLSLAMIGYVMLSATSYFVLIVGEKPRPDEGEITRKILQSSTRRK